MLNKLTYWLQLYQQGELFPQVAEGSKHCEFCQYVTRCDRDRYDGEEALSLKERAEASSGDLSQWLENLDNIQEVSL